MDLELILKNHLKCFLVLHFNCVQNYDEDERTVRTTYSSSGGNPDTIYLSSQGVSFY